MELKPFDPADYLNSEGEFEAYLTDARRDGAAATARAIEVVARARARIAGRLKTTSTVRETGRAAGRSSR